MGLKFAEGQLPRGLAVAAPDVISSKSVEPELTTAGVQTGVALAKHRSAIALVEFVKVSVLSVQFVQGTEALFSSLLRATA